MWLLRQSILYLFTLSYISAYGQNLPSQGQDYTNRRIATLSVNDGLTQGSLYGILKDHEGYMWFTSNEGLNRYDGYDVKTEFQHLHA